MSTVLGNVLIWLMILTSLVTCTAIDSHRDIEMEKAKCHGQLKDTQKTD